jgi:hypothetical protein
MNGVPRKEQRGVVMVTVAVAMLVLIAMAGLALDMGHAYVNKTRLQNALDAAALSGARVLMSSRSMETAEAAARATLLANLEEGANRELTAIAPPTVEVDFSSSITSFVGCTDGADGDCYFIRVRAFDTQLRAFLIPVLGFNEKRVGGSAVAGPRPLLGMNEDGELCNLAPVMICGTPPSEASEEDLANPDWFFGYEMDGSEIVLKTNSKESPDWGVGPGNFQLIRLGGGQGADNVRSNMAGDYSACLTPNEDTVPTEPGNTVGPSAQGLNTRFDCPPPGCGPLTNNPDYPPDKIITPGTYAEYLEAVAEENWDRPWGTVGRRELSVAIGDCRESVSGQGEVPLLGFGCFFLTRPTVQKGNEQEIYGEFIGTCLTAGRPAPDPGRALDRDFGPYRIVLYKDPDSSDS